MDKLIIHGPSKLSGNVSIDRSKNACLPILMGVLINPHPITLNDLPKLRDINTTLNLLKELGVEVSESGKFFRDRRVISW